MMIIITIITAARGDCLHRCDGPREHQSNVSQVGAWFLTPSLALAEICGADGVRFRDSCNDWGALAVAHSALVGLLF